MNHEATSAEREKAPSTSEASSGVAQPPPPPRPILSRRVFLLGSFWTGIALAAAASVGSTLDFMWPRKVSGFGSPIDVDPSKVPKPGEDPLQVPEGRFWLVNLAPSEGGSSGGLLAFYWKCPHLGCTVPYSPSFEFAGRKGWFRCPCHGSTFTREGGIRVSGPASRDMDTMRIEVKPDGSIVVDTGDITPGSKDNPQRAAPYPGPGSSPPAQAAPPPGETAG